MFKYNVIHIIIAANNDIIKNVVKSINSKPPIIKNNISKRFLLILRNITFYNTTQFQSLYFMFVH